MIGITITWTVAFFFAFLFLCGSHPQSYWTSAKVELQKCVKTQELHDALVISDMILDIIIISMSIPVVSVPIRPSTLRPLIMLQVWRSKMSRWKKLAVAGMFVFGSL